MRFIFKIWCIFVFNTIDCDCYFVYNSPNDSAPFEVYIENERKVTMKLFDKIPAVPSQAEGRRLLQDLEEYNLSFAEFLHYLVFDRLTYLLNTRSLVKSGGPVPLRRTINETHLREMYSFNDTDMKRLKSELNITRVIWKRFDVFT